MGHPYYTIRNYHPRDFDNYVKLHVEAERLDPAGRCTSPQALAERLGRPNHTPERDLFIAEAAGEIIGYIAVTPELGIGRAVLDCLIHPEHRHKGLATELSRYALSHSRELGAGVAHVSISRDNVAAKSLLSKLGFRCIRRFLELRLELPQSPLSGLDPLDLRCHPLRPGEEAKLAQLQNRSFAGTWGYNPNTIEDITYRIGMSDCSHQDIILVAEGDKPIGYCWTTKDWEESPAPAGSKGRIYMLGVDPHYRGRGIGKRLLLAGLSHLKRRGGGVAELTVDSQNKAACALYESIGFRISATTLWYEKVLD